MKAETRITFFDDQGQKFFGKGPYHLLLAVDATGSLRAAAEAMKMAYTKALKLVNNAETALGFPLTMRVTGGKNGGGSCLTPEGRNWLKQYEAYCSACIQANQQLYQEYFEGSDAPSPILTGEDETSSLPRPTHSTPCGNLGCVIMASGLGKRFGGNKLMAEFRGEPLICRAFSATEGIFAHRVVVTRHEEIAALCRESGIAVVIHDLPHRSDTVHLGLDALGDVDGAMFCPGDQPLLRQETVAALAAAGNEDTNSIWRTCFGDTPGSPVLFPKWTFPELRNLPEGMGGSHVVKKYPERVRTVPVRDQYELMDVDTQEDLHLLREQ